MQAIRYVARAREEGAEEVNSDVPQFSLIKNPFPSVILKSFNPVFPSSDNGGGMEEFAVAITPLQPVTSGLLVPKQLFLGKEFVIFSPKVPLNLRKILVVSPLPGSLNTLDSVEHLPPSPRDVSHTVAVPLIRL